MQSTHPKAHLSLGVRSIRESLAFFVDVLEAEITHEDDSGYVNLALHGCQITLKENPAISPDLPDFHFGFNMKWGDFESLTGRILARTCPGIVMKPKVMDPGTPLERIKMYLKCPTGYLIELKGYH